MKWPRLAPLLQGSVHTRCVVNKVNNSIVIVSCNHLQPCIADVISSRYPETYFASLMSCFHVSYSAVEILWSAEVQQSGRGPRFTINS